jgi:uncharacterized protein DUF262
MKRKVEAWPAGRLHKERAQISFPDYQRQSNLWSTEKKSLLIDSILQDIDIPKLYFNHTAAGGYEVVDGQQRLWAIWEFLDDEYPYNDQGKARRFSSLSKTQRDAITNYEMQVVVIEDADDDYLRELFLRLQLGVLLITGEKLNASSGAMKEVVFKTFAKHPFIQEVGIPARRFAKETVAAQVCINSFTKAKLGFFARTRYEDLLQFFMEYEHPQGQDLQFFQMQGRKIINVMDGLIGCLGDNTKQLRNRAYILSVYLLFEELFNEGKVGAPKEQKTFARFVYELWGRLREEIEAGMDRKNQELYTFETLISSASGEKYQIERRHQKMSEYYAHFIRTGKVKGD